MASVLRLRFKKSADQPARPYRSKVVHARRAVKIARRKGGSSGRQGASGSTSKIQVPWATMPKADGIRCPMSGKASSGLMQGLSLRRSPLSLCAKPIVSDRKPEGRLAR